MCLRTEIWLRPNDSEFLGSIPASINFLLLERPYSVSAQPSMDRAINLVSQCSAAWISKPGTQISTASINGQLSYGKQLWTSI